MAEKRNQNKRLRVVILGAGVSASCGIPVAKDILRESMIRLAEVNSAKTRDVLQLLKYLYPDFEEAYRNYPNIEDFLNLIEMALTFNSSEFIESTLWPRTRLLATKQVVLDAISEYIWGFCANPHPSWHHMEAFFEKHVPIGDVVITFNWDLTVEQVLARTRNSTPIAYQFSKEDHQHHLTLLKPHGSINWFYTKALTAARIRGAKTLDSKIKLLEFHNLLLSRDLIKATPLIIPPISNKGFTEHTVFQETWSSVYRALSSATVLTILGYSLPREDQFARLVFRRALRNNIRRIEKHEKRPLKMIVVNPDEATEATFARLSGRERVEFAFHRSYFQDFVTSLT